VSTPQPAIEVRGAYEAGTAERHALSLLLTVSGMQCASCGVRLEKELKRTPGVVDAAVSFLTDTARITYAPHTISPRELLAQITRLGYHPFVHGGEAEHGPREQKMFLRMGIALVLTFNAMMISYALDGGFFAELSRQAVWYVSFPAWALSTVVLFFCGFHIIRKGLAGFYALHFSMDSLIAMGALSAYAYSTARMFAGSLHLYFDTASMLVTLVLLGRYIESRSRKKVTGFITGLYSWSHQKVRVGGGGGERWVPADTLAPGDIFTAEAGDRVPLDARVADGRAVIDQSVLTGEPKPVGRSTGEEVLGGSLLLSGSLTLEVLRTGGDGFLGHMIALMEDAVSRKNALELIADRVMQWLVPAILTIAAAAALYLLLEGRTMETALLRSISVLVITCPCALGIAVPLAKTAFVAAAQEKGIMVRSTDALERAPALDTLVFDKTGTLTRGCFSLQETVTDGVPEDEALVRVASIETRCDHFLAHEILKIATQKSSPLHAVATYKNRAGLGVSGFIAGDEVIAGNRLLINEAGFHLSSELDEQASAREAKGKTVVFFGWEHRVRGFFTFGDTIKQNAPDVIRTLKSHGVTPWLISGDAAHTTRVVAETLGIHHYQGQATPRDKVTLIQELQAQGKRVGMVGDGINDAASLAGADVGFAIGSRVPLTRQAADVGLLADDPVRVLDFLDLSKITMKTIRQNLFFAFIYNAVAIPLALAGLVNPLVAVCAMFASSLTVVGNTLRISRQQKG